MTVVRKRFDKALHDKTDKLAKQTAIAILEKAGHKVVENPNRHAVDLLVYNDKDEHIFNCEVEIKTNWKTGTDFKYPDVNFLDRKAKYCKLDKPTVFVIFNEDLSQYLSVKGSDVLSSPQEVVKNKYCYDGELFYKLPLTKVKFNDIVSSIKEIV